MSDIYLTSDTHFGHGNIIKFCNRPFENAREMDEVMIEKWNAKVKSEDIVMHLGDFAYGGSQYIKRLVQSLNGKISLLLGDHDRETKLWDAGFLDIRRYVTIENKAVLFHWPIESWQGAFRKVYHFHGHSHGNLKHKLPRRMDISVDCTNFEPLHFDEAIAMAPDGKFSEDNENEDDTKDVHPNP